MTLGQRIVDKIDTFPKDEGKLTHDKKKEVLADCIDDILAEVGAKYAGVLRDKFAGDALIAMLTHEKNICLVGGNDLKGIYEMARDCYLMAEAMMKARGE